MLMLALAGCGYTIKRSPVASVHIGMIENMTSEARLNDRLTEALVAAFMKNGIQVRGSSEHSVEGTIESLELNQLAEAGDVTTTYRVVVKGEFFLVGPDGKKTKLANTGKYIITFSSEGSLTPIIAGKELAIRQALDDMADEIAASVLFMQ